ncbi:LysR substrate-binding domain-containing protein [Paraburkholderia youngii]|uniref:LysR substrate-binding domain-containing protein n=1 Tax=Paraburkholderia youngii TaxID=2782701 RepID=UPI003D1FA43F
MGGRGIAIFPGIPLASFPHRDLVARRLEAPLVARDVNLIRRAEHSLSPAAQSFIELWYKRIGKPAGQWRAVIAHGLSYCMNIQ